LSCSNSRIAAFRSDPRTRIADWTTLTEEVSVWSYRSPVLFEVGNFVAQIRVQEVRALQAKRLLSLFDLAAKGFPWIVPLASGDEVWTRSHLHDCMTRFVAAQDKPQLGLTDAAVIYEAERLKADRLWPKRVHI
jgi:hypothetical protein